MKKFSACLLALGLLGCASPARPLSAALKWSGRPWLAQGEYARAVALYRSELDDGQHRPGRDQAWFELAVSELGADLPGGQERAQDILRLLHRGRGRPWSSVAGVFLALLEEHQRLGDHVAASRAQLKALKAQREVASKELHSAELAHHQMSEEIEGLKRRAALQEERLKALGAQLDAIKQIDLDPPP